jgi:hypothetical protein
VNTTGHTFGVLSGYSTGANYDLATGLGSVDANALVTNWSSVTFKSSATTMTAPTPTSITHGQQVSTTISVAAVAPATGTPTGDVSLITSTGQSVGGFTLSGGSVNATTNLLPGGTYTVSAHYAGDGTFGGSDSAPSASITVTPEASKTTVRMETFDFNTGNQINANATTAVYGSLYLLRTDVTNAAGTSCAPAPSGNSGCPTGTIAWSDNGGALDSGNFILNSLGYSEDQSVSLAAGSHNLNAQYPGDASFTASSGTDSVTITKAATSFTTFVIPATGTTTNSVEFQASVSAQSLAAAPTGTVTFFSDGVSIGTVSGPGTAGTNTGTASLSVSFFPTLPAGTHTITATYSGDTNYAGASSGSATIKIALPAPNVSIDPPTQTIAAGSSATVMAVVDSPTAGPAITGSISFVDAANFNPITGTVTLTPGTDSNGNPTLSGSLTFTPASSISVIAQYSGDSNYPSAQSPTPTTPTITVTGNDFSLSSPGTATVAAGANVSVKITVSGQSGYNGTISFTQASCSGLPPEATCNFSPALLTGSGSTLVTVFTATPHARGGKQATLSHGPQLWTLTSGGLLSCVLLFGVPKKRRWSKMLSLLFFALLITSVSCGGGGSSGGSGGGGGGGSGAGDPGTPKGTYTVTITGTSGSLTHSTSFSLTVQ